jgi:hypothetical protein
MSLLDAEQNWGVGQKMGVPGASQGVHGLENR